MVAVVANSTAGIIKRLLVTQKFTRIKSIKRVDKKNTNKRIIETFYPHVVMLTLVPQKKIVDL